MKKLLYIIGGAVVTTGIILAVRSQITPKFSVDKIDNLAKTGEFTFSGIQNSFGIGQNKSVPGRSGFSLSTNTGTDGKTVIFKLYKNGKFVADLKQVSFT